MSPTTSSSASLSRPLAAGGSHSSSVAVLSAAIAFSLTAALPFSGAGSNGGEPAVPPGQEEILLEVFGKGQDFAGCRLVDGQAIYTEVIATYQCGSGEATVAAVHRSKGERGAVPTERFAITLQSGSPPPGFMNALVSHVRSREKDFEWLWLYDPPRVGESSENANAAETEHP